MKKMLKEEFVLNANIIHKNKYDYSSSIFINTKTKIVIICPIHGKFKQIPSEHLRSSGCKKCFIEQQRKINKTNFISKANEIHNKKYDYSLTKYTNIYTKVKILCPKHGQFFQNPKNHLNVFGCK